MDIIGATIETGGKQYRVKAGDTFLVERLPVAAGEKTTVDRVLLIERADGKIAAGDECKSAKAEVAVIAHLRGEKLRVFKMRRRKKSRRTAGHRQNLTRVQVVGFSE